jgi:peptide/nickel transport system permease protein
LPSAAAVAELSRRGPSSVVTRLIRQRPAALAAVWLLAVTVVGIVGPGIYQGSYEAVDVASQFAAPGGKYPLGADENGRDVLARLMFGGRVSLVVGVVAAALGIIVGIVIGATAGQMGGRVDAALMRVTDTFMSLPTFFFLLMLLALFGGGIPVLVVGIGLTSWEGVARVVRSEVLRHKGMEFIQAARAVGVTEGRLMLRHLLPQAIPSIIVATMLGVAHAILAEAALSYLGLGVRVPVPSWGNMLSGAQNYLFVAPLLAVWPGLLIMLTVLALNIFGDGLRDVLDPQLSGEPD